MTLFVKLDPENNRPQSFFDDKGSAHTYVPKDAVQINKTECNQLQANPHRVTFNPETRIIGIVPPLGAA